MSNSGMNTSFGIDLKEFNKGIKKITKSFKTIQKTTKKMGKTYEKDFKNTNKKVGNSFKDVVKENNKMNTQVLSGVSSLSSQMENKFKNSVKKMSESFKTIGTNGKNSFINVKSNVDKTIQKFKIGANAVNSFANKIKNIKSGNSGLLKIDTTLTKLKGSFKEVGEKAKKLGGIIGKALKAGAAMGTAALGMVVKSSETVKSSNRKVENSFALSSAEIQRLQGNIKNIAKTGVGNIEDVTNAVIQTKTQMRSLNGVSLEKVVKGAMALSKTFDVDVKETTRAADQLMSQFGISGEKAMEFMVSGFKNGLDYGDDFIDTVNEYSVYFDKMGFSVNDMFSIFKSGAESGARNLDKVGDAIKEFGIRSKDASKSTQNAFMDLGLDAVEMTKIFSAGGEKAKSAYALVVNKLKEVKDETERNAIGVALWGTQYEDNEEKIINSTANMKNSLKGLDGSLDDLIENQNSLGNVFQGVWNSIQYALEPVADIIGKDLKKQTDKFVVSLEKVDFTKMYNGIKKVGDYFKDTFGPLIDVIKEKIKAAFSKLKINIDMEGLKSVLKTIAVLFQKVVQGITWFIDKFDWLIAAVLIFVGVAAGLIAAVLTIVKVFRIVASVIAAITSPIGIVVAAIIGLIAVGTLVYKHWDKIKGFLTNIFNKIKDTAVGIFDSIKTKITNIFNGIKSFWSEWGETITWIIFPVFKFIYEFIKSNSELIKKVIVGVWNGIKAFFMTIWNSIKTLAGLQWGYIKLVIINPVKQIVKGIKENFAKVKENMTGPFEKAKSAIKGILDGIKKMIGEVGAKLKELIKTPKIKIETKHKTVAGVDVPYPSVDVKWHQNGGIIKGSKEGQIVGVGEKGGTEAIIPLSDKRRMAPFAAAVADMMPNNGTAAAAAAINNVYHINVDKIDSDVDIKKLAQEITELQKRNDRMGGRR